MRRLVVLLLLAGLFCVGMPAPGHAQSAPQWGLSLGLNVTTVQAPGRLGVRQMAAGGVVMTWPLWGPAALQSKLLLNQKGTVVKGGGGGIRYGAGYLDLPVLLRLDGPSLGGVTPYVVGGGFGGVKVFERQRAGGELRFTLNSETSFFRRTNAGLTAGAGGTLPIGGDRRLNLSLHYAHGLVDVARSVDEQPYDEAPFPATAQTRTWSVRLRFGL
jgi:hypothetical protein